MATNGSDAAATAARDYARQYIERGLSIDIWHKFPGAKGPRQKRVPIYDVEHLPDDFAQDTCIAIRLDPMHVCVDLDTEAAQAMAPAFLPATEMISGRVGRPATHWWYELEVEDTDRRRTKFEDPSNLSTQRPMLLEYIHISPHTRQQTTPIIISPPSPYDDSPWRERAYWDSFGAAGTTTADVLYRRCSVLASACLLSRCWTKGSRNQLTLAISGALLREHWSIDQIKRLLGPIAEFTRDEELEQRLVQPEGTDERAKAGYSTYGWPTVEETIGADRTQRLRRWLTATSGPVTTKRVVAVTPDAVADQVDASTLRYVADAREWASYTGGRWTLGHIAELDAQGVVELELKNMIAATRGARPLRWRDVEDAVSALRRRREVRVALDEFDGQNGLLNGPDGTHDLDKEVMLDPLAEHYLTRQMPTPYDPNAECPTWLAQLEATWPDRDVRDYLQRAVGYSLQGTQHERCFFLLYGQGRNGKSLFLRVLEHVLGTHRFGYAQAVSPAAFGRQAMGEIHSGLARLRGVRFATVNEFPNRAMAADLIKAITGGEVNTARELRQSVIEFPFQCKLWFTSNFKPGPTDAADDAFWERMHPIECATHFPRRGEPGFVPEQELVNAMFSESSGILNWMFEGYRMWREIGLELPDVLRITRDEYREDIDLVQQFLDMPFCEVFDDRDDEGAKLPPRYTDTTLAHVWHVFDDWATTEGYDRRYRTQVHNSRELKRALQQKGFIVDNPYKTGDGHGGQNHVGGLRVTYEPFGDELH